MTTCGIEVSGKILRDGLAAEAHFGGEFAALERERAVEEDEAVDLFFAGGVGEAAGDFGGVEGVARCYILFWLS